MAEPNRAATRLVLALLAMAALAAVAIRISWQPSPDREPQSLRVGAAISLRPALEEIAEKYRSQTGGAVEMSYGSSGQLMGQIAGGAPIDLFISAAHQQVDHLAARGLAGEKRVIATNALVLVVPADAEDAPGGFEALAGPEVKRLAIGEPRTVPAGAYAEQALERLGLSAAVRDRLVYGLSARQVLSYVERGEVSAGIVYRTDAMASGGRVRLVATTEGAWHDAIEYPAAIVAGTADRAAAQAFLEFLGSGEARVVFARHGFGPPP